MIRGIALAALLMAGCAMQPGEYTTTPLSAAQTEKVKAAVAYNLRDASSARWRNIATVTTKNGRSYVCGQVNATNGFGGYTGFMPFFGTWREDGSFFLQGRANPDDAYGYLAICPR